MPSDVSNIIVIIFIVGACIGLAFIPAKIASKKGYSYSLFYIFGLFGVVPALITVLLFKDTSAAPIGTKGVSTLIIILVIAILAYYGIGIISAGTRSNPLETKPLLLNDSSIQDKVSRITNDKYFGYKNDWGWDLSKIMDVLGTDCGTMKSSINGMDIKIFNVDNKEVKVVFFDGYATSVEILD